MYFCFLGPECTYKASICDFAVTGNFVFGNEGNGVCALDAVGDALGASTKFVGGRVKPIGFGGWVGDEGTVLHTVACDGIDDGVGKGVVGEVVGCLEEGRQRGVRSGLCVCLL